MPEILTESFCERCGTRYTFESAAPRATRLKGVKVLSRGLKNFVMSDDTSLDEAMAAARSDTDREVTTRQLDAFHKTFNFCMQCRQYTCANCWNEAEGRCLTCAPHLGQDILEAPFPTLAVSPGVDLRAETNGNGANGHHHDPSLDSLAWPTSDLMRHDIDEGGSDETAALEDDIEPIDAVARLAALDGEPGSTDLADPPTAVVDAPEVESAATATSERESLDVAAVAPAPPLEAPSPDPVLPLEASSHDPVPPLEAPSPDPATADASELTDVERRVAAAAAATADLLRSFRPGDSLDAALEAYERERAAADSPASAAEPTVDVPSTAQAAIDTAALAPEPQPEPVVADEPVVLEPVSADPAAAPGAVADQSAAAAAEPVEPGPVPPSDRVEQPTWRIVAPDAQATPAGTSEPAVPIAPPIAASAEPQWPAQPQWPSHTPSTGLPFLGRPVTPTGGIEALWAESAREVSSVPTSGPAALAAPGDARAAGGVQPCVSCGLSLSATARFCRRCGSRQG